MGGKMKNWDRNVDENGAPIIDSADGETNVKENKTKKLNKNKKIKRIKK